MGMSPLWWLYSDTSIAYSDYSEVVVLITSHKVTHQGSNNPVHSCGQIGKASLGTCTRGNRRNSRLSRFSGNSFWTNRNLLVLYGLNGLLRCFLVSSHGIRCCFDGDSLMPRGSQQSTAWQSSLGTYDIFKCNRKAHLQDINLIPGKDSFSIDRE